MVVNLGLSPTITGHWRVERRFSYCTLLFSAAFSLWLPLEVNTGKEMVWFSLHVQLGIWERARKGEGNHFIDVKELSGGVEVCTVGAGFPEFKKVIKMLTLNT